MSSGADIRSELHARAILKLALDAPPSAWRAAFQREAKAAHPDRGGDSERMRLVIEAYRFLKTADSSAKPEPRARPQAKASRPKPRPEPTAEPQAEADPFPEQAQPPLLISIVEAFRGAERMVRLKNGRKFKVRLPTGLQTGDVVRFGAKGEHRLSIAVENLERAELKGADLWIVVGVSR